MKLEEAKKKLTPREFQFLEAMLSKDDMALRAFGDDAVLLAKNVEYKILEAGGLDEGPASVENNGTQLKLFDVPEPGPPEPAIPEAPELPGQKLEEAADKLSKSNFKERGKNKVIIPPVPGASSILPAGELDGLERKEGDGPALGALSKSNATDILDEAGTGHAPFRKGDIIRGDRVLFKATGAIHKVSGVDRTTEPHTVKIEVFGKTMDVSRELLAKIAPTHFDQRWQRRRGHRRQVVRYPTQYSESAPAAKDGYDPQDRSS